MRRQALKVITIAIIIAIVNFIIVVTIIIIVITVNDNISFRLSRANCFIYLGAHLNPAITVAVAILGEMKWVKVPIYCLAQYLAAFVASACVYGLYYGKSRKHPHGDDRCNCRCALRQVINTKYRLENIMRSFKITLRKFIYNSHDLTRFSLNNFEHR